MLNSLSDERSNHEPIRSNHRDHERDAAVQQLGLKSLEARVKKEYVSPMEFAYAYARLRDRDKTMEWLEKAYRERSPRLVRLTMEPDLKSMQNDPRFMNLVKRVGLITGSGTK